MYKTVVFLYTSNKLLGCVIKKDIKFTVARKNAKYLGINVAKYMQDHSGENCKTF